MHFSFFSILFLSVASFRLVSSRWGGFPDDLVRGVIFGQLVWGGRGGFRRLGWGGRFVLFGVVRCGGFGWFNWGYGGGRGGCLEWERWF